MSLLFGCRNIPCNKISWMYHGFCWWEHFGEHVTNISREFEKMYEKYGDGYLRKWDMMIPHMLLRLQEEVDEISGTENYDELYEEILDVANVSLMLLEIVGKRRMNNEIQDNQDH